MARSAVTPNYGLSLDTVGNVASDNAIKELAMFVDDKARAGCSLCSLRTWGRRSSTRTSSRTTSPREVLAS